MKRLLALFLFAAVFVSAQDDLVFRSGVSLVRVDAEAIDGSGHVVPGLTKDDFRILDEASPQPIVNFSFAEEPLDLILLFDTAGSMHGKLLNLVRATELGFNELRKGDRVCVRVYSGVTAEIIPFTADLQVVNEAILTKVFTLRFGGASRVQPAADAAALRFRTEPRTHRKRAVLIVTDKPAVREPNEMAVVRDLWSSDAVLSELIMGGSPQASAGIVEKTGGTTIVAGDPGPSFRDAVHYLRSGYTIYYALPDGNTGSERRLQVELTPEAAKRLPDVRVHARSGYIVPAAAK